jgi:hypothetical protein
MLCYRQDGQTPTEAIGCLIGRVLKPEADSE